MALASQIRHVEVLDTSATDGSGLAGKVYSDFTAKYCIDGGTLISLTTETITTLGTYQAPTSSAHIRIKELNSADPTKGMYEVHFHNDQLTSGTRLWLYMSVAGGKVQRLEVDLVDVKDVNVLTLPSIPANWITAAGIAADAITAAKVAADVTTEIQSGLATASELAKVPKSDGTVAFNATAVAGMQSGLATASALATAQSDLDIITGTDGVTLATSQPNYAPATAAALDAVDNFIDTEIADIQSRLPAALVGGRMDASVGAMATDVVTASAVAAGAIDADAISADACVEIAAAVWDRVLSGATHNIVNSAGRRLRQIDAAFAVHSGTAQGGTTTTITLDTGASTTDDIYNGDRIVIVGGTGIGSHALITDYVGSTRVATVSKTFIITPDATSEFEIVPADVDVEAWNNVPVTGDGDWSELQTDVDSILLDTNELQTDWADGGRLDLILDARASQTSVDTIDNFLDTEIAAILEDTGTTLPAQIAAITTTQLTEGYAADGVAPTLEEATFMILQSLHEFAITGTSRTAKKLDGTTTAMVFTLDSDTAPTSTTRSA